MVLVCTVLSVPLSSMRHTDCVEVLLNTAAHRAVRTQDNMRSVSMRMSYIFVVRVQSQDCLFFVSRLGLAATAMAGLVSRHDFASSKAEPLSAVI